MYRARGEVELSIPVNALDFIETLPSKMNDTNYAESVIIEIDGSIWTNMFFLKKLSQISQN